MSDETPNRSPEVRHAGGGAQRSVGEQSPLQTRAAFLQNWDWQSVIRHNRGVCERGGAQHGQNSESYGALAAEWRRRQAEVATLDEVIEFLRQCHRRAPFLFFSGNTFAELPTTRRREVMSAGQKL
jgi:hypothetical protein